MKDVPKPVLKQVIVELPQAPKEAATPPEPPRAIPPPSPPFSKKILAIVLGSTLALALAVWWMVAHRTKSTQAVSNAGRRTATVEARNLVSTLRLNGTIEAVQSRAILTPMLAGAQLNSLVITKLTPAGSKVKKAALLVEFDRQSQIKAFLDKQAEYRDLMSQVAQKQAEEAAARAKDETELKQAEDELKRADLENLKNDIISRIDAEKNRETLEQARANLKQLGETFELKRRAAQAAIRVLEIQRDRARETLRHFQRNEEKMAIRSPMDGVVVLNTIWKGGKMGEVQEGDEVRPGVPFMQVVDPSRMEVRARVNQVDVLSMRVGQPAQVRLDAYPELSFTATVEQVAPMGVHSQLSEKVQYFQVRLSIQGSDPKLMPDLSAAVDVELESLPNVLVVPRDSLIVENGKTFVRVRRSLGTERRAVKIGLTNDIEAVVEAGLQKGEVVERNVEAAETGS